MNDHSAVVISQEVLENLCRRARHIKVGPHILFKWQDLDTVEFGAHFSDITPVDEERGSWGVGETEMEVTGESRAVGETGGRGWVSLRQLLRLGGGDG